MSDQGAVPTGTAVRPASRDSTVNPLCYLCPRPVELRANGDPFLLVALWLPNGEPYRDAEGRVVAVHVHVSCWDRPAAPHTRTGDRTNVQTTLF